MKKISDQKLEQASWARAALQSAETLKGQLKALENFMDAFGEKRPSDLCGAMSLPDVAVAMDALAEWHPKTYAGTIRFLWRRLQILESLVFWETKLAEKKEA